MAFEKKLLDWYHVNARKLPWRETRDPYRIWLSEVILQQTKVDQGLNYYHRILSRFPNVEILALSDDEVLLKLWQGLGYYHRAKNMLKTARLIHTQYDNEFPRSVEELLKLPGIGPYTACAIAAFANDFPCQVLDGNVLRVVSRVFGVKADIQSKDTIKKIQKILSKENILVVSSMFNQSIMEFGALNCTYKSPQCDDCIMKEDCFAFQNQCVSLIPFKGSKVKVKKQSIYYLAIYVEKEKKILLKKRSLKGIWPGLYDFPEINMDSMPLHKVGSIEKICLENGVKNPNIQEGIFQMKHKLTHRELNIVFTLVVTSEQIGSSWAEGEYVLSTDSATFPVPKPIDDFLVFLRKKGLIK